MEVEKLIALVDQALDDMKAQDVQGINVSGRSPVTEHMFIATGNSTRHVKSIANSIVNEVKAIGMMPLGVEGEESANWVLVDLGDVIVHVMLAEARDFYNLEKLWERMPDTSDKQQAL